MSKPKIVTIDQLLEQNLFNNAAFVRNNEVITPESPEWKNAGFKLVSHIVKKMIEKSSLKFNSN